MQQSSQKACKNNRYYFLDPSLRKHVKIIGIILQTLELIEDLKSVGGMEIQGGKSKLKLIP